MSEIRKGDLVMVVRSTGCCGAGVAIGRMFVIETISDTRGYHCVHCGSADAYDTRVALNPTAKRWYALSRLKKIDPLSEPEAEVHREERSTPASKPEVAVSKSKVRV